MVNNIRLDIKTCVTGALALAVDGGSVFDLEKGFVASKFPIK